MEKHFLEQYAIHNKPEAEAAAERKEIRTGETGIVQDRSKGNRQDGHHQGTARYDSKRRIFRQKRREYETTHRDL